MYTHAYCAIPDPGSVRYLYKKGHSSDRRSRNQIQTHTHIHPSLSSAGTGQQGDRCVRVWHAAVGDVQRAGRVADAQLLAAAAEGGRSQGEASDARKRAPWIQCEHLSIFGCAPGIQCEALSICECASGIQCEALSICECAPELLCISKCEYVSIFECASWIQCDVFFIF